LIVRKNNPKQISQLRDLTHPSIRFINRQPESGTRLLFDHLLKSNQIDPHHIQGYQTEEFTHMAIAAMVASGMADVGFGIEPAAEKLGLMFIPLIWEHYCLAVPNVLLQDERIQRMISLLHHDEFKDLVSPYAGYQAERAGEMLPFADVFDRYSATQ
jgi:molybdate-binding protein